MGLTGIKMLEEGSWLMGRNNHEAFTNRDCVECGKKCGAAHELWDRVDDEF